MHGIWDSPAWRSLFTFTGTPGNLTFSLYIDWFNPLTNKISGKKISCGAIMLNMFFAGIIPGPKEPSIVTMTHALQPLIDELLPFWAGKQLPTFLHPNGRLIRVALIPFIADLIAMRKICKYFCSYCLCTLDQVDRLDETVREQAVAWRAATTKTARKELFRDSGVRWSPLHDLPYWDPVRHLHHSRAKWGVGSTKLHGPRDTRRIYNLELIELEEESSGYDDTPAQRVRDRSQSTGRDSPSLIASSSASVAPEDSDSDAMDAAYVGSDEGSDEEDPQPLDDILAAACIFTAPQLELIRTCIRDVLIPEGLERPPVNFGEAAHGRLKASAWLTTFTNFLPMVIPEIWAVDGATEEQRRLFDNFYHLVASTNIVSSYVITPGDDQEYLQHYVSYRQSCRDLFLHSASVPNHHYAMHVPSSCGSGVHFHP
ncbi:hypothetical protein EXIGLDRAFT_713049 [Exidia glandulosa HHB12029]|uniref:Uncharacterized protein n=1 Tax=Exidia glandulosa HHB12029 TaxID=1314781 RepID=A0A165D0R6_EXIGL|nr:hypothetical protein EXIGLDRAFT_713049 [Exidia glandulosa HHB12029]